jgi:hypothetical protein
MWVGQSLQGVGCDEQPKKPKHEKAGGGGVYIRFCGDGGWRFRSNGYTHQHLKRSQKKRRFPFQEEAPFLLK